MRYVSALLVFSLLFDTLAFAVNNQEYLRSRSQTKVALFLKTLVEKKQQQFLKMPVEKQRKLLERTDQRFSALIRKAEKWSEQKFESKKNRAAKFLGKNDESYATPNEQQEINNVSLSTEEQEFIADDLASLQPDFSQVSFSKTEASKAQFIENLKKYQSQVRDELSKYAQKGKLNRKIANLEFGGFAAIFCVLLALGITLLAVGSLVIVGTLGLAAPAAIAMLTVGSLCIVGDVALVSWLFSQNLVGP